MDRRPLNLKDLDAAVADARALHASGYQKAGAWDLTQACRHCAKALNSTLDGFGFKPPLPLRLLIKLLGMKKKMYRTRQIRPGLPAPAAQLFDPAGGDPTAEASAVQELADAAERLKQHAGAYARNPGFGVLTRDEWLEFHTIHTMHHLSFLVPNAAPATP